MNKLSAVVLAKNEESNIGKCLESLSWCDEILVIDDFSTDNTSKIARKHGTKVIKHNLSNNFAQQRNFGLSKTSNEWILFVDADEVVSDELRDNIKKKLQNPDQYGYFLERKNYYYNKQLGYGEWGKTKLIRLGRKSAGRWTRAVHEHWDISKAGKIDGMLIHNSPQSTADFLTKIERYSGIHAIENSKEDKSANFYKVIVFPIGKFLKNYLIDKGYKDGIQGFIMSTMMSFHSFLSWGQLWLQRR